jgi:hypothetical protein
MMSLMEGKEEEDIEEALNKMSPEVNEREKNKL